MKTKNLIITTLALSTLLNVSFANNSCQDLSKKELTEKYSKLVPIIRNQVSSQEKIAVNATVALTKLRELEMKAEGLPFGTGINNSEDRKNMMIDYVRESKKLLSAAMISSNNKTFMGASSNPLKNIDNDSKVSVSRTAGFRDEYSYTTDVQTLELSTAESGEMIRLISKVDRKNIVTLADNTECTISIETIFSPKDDQRNDTLSNIKNITCGNITVSKGSDFIDTSVYSSYRQILNNPKKVVLIIGTSSIEEAKNTESAFMSSIVNNLVAKDIANNQKECELEDKEVGQDVFSERTDSNQK